VHRIPELGPTSRGKAIVNLLELSGDERVATTVAVREFGEGYLVFATEKGTIKKTELAAFSNPRAGGIIAINIDEDDRLLDVRVTDGEHDVFLATAGGLSIRFAEAGVRPMGRATRGVRGIALTPGDRVVGMETLAPEGDLLTVSERGYGKRTALEEYRQQSRAGKGIINLKVSSKTGKVVGVKQVNPTDGLVLITQGGKLIRINVDGVSLIGRSTQGVRVMNLGADDRLVAVAKIVERDDESEDQADDEAAPAAPSDAPPDAPPAEEPIN
jgi:DNA gyrase subunit A